LKNKTKIIISKQQNEFFNSSFIEYAA
jgi:hypothetical protein